MDNFTSNNILAKETAEAKEICRKLTEDLDHAKSDLAEAQRSLRERNYEIARLSAIEAQSKEAIKSVDVKYRATVASLKKSLDLVEQQSIQRQQVLSRDCEIVLGLLRALEQHTMHGHHTVNSTIFSTLLRKLHKGVEVIKQGKQNDYDSENPCDADAAAVEVQIIRTVNRLQRG